MSRCLSWVGLVCHDVEQPSRVALILPFQHEQSSPHVSSGERLTFHATPGVPYCSAISESIAWYMSRARCVLIPYT